MGWGISGDIGDDLAQILAQQVAMQLQREQLNEIPRRRQFELEDRERRRVLDEDAARDRDEDRALRARQIAGQEEERTEQRRVANMRRRGQSNMAGVIGMGLEPEAAKREIAFSALNNDADIPSGVMDAITPPRVQRHAVTVMGPNGRPIRRLVPESELEAGVEEYRAPERGPAAPREPKQWVIGPDGNQYHRVPQAGDRRHDPVAERQARPTNDTEAIDTAREVQRIARSLRQHPGVRGAFGVVDSRLPTLRQSTADAEVLRNSLTSLLTLENTGKLKGVLSNADMEILRRASSTISPEMGDDAAIAELERVEQVMDKITRGTLQQPAPDGGGAVEYVRDPQTGRLVRKR